MDDDQAAKPRSTLEEVNEVAGETEQDKYPDVQVEEDLPPEDAGSDAEGSGGGGIGVLEDELDGLDYGGLTGGNDYVTGDDVFDQRSRPGSFIGSNLGEPHDEGYVDDDILVKDVDLDDVDMEVIVQPDFAAQVN